MSKKEALEVLKDHLFAVKASANSSKSVKFFPEDQEKLEKAIQVLSD